MRPRGVIEDLGARAPQIIRVAPGDRHEAAQPDLSVAGGELGLASGGRLARLPLPSGLGLPEAAAQLTVGAVTGDRRFDFARRAVERQRLERDRHRAHRAGAAEQRVHEHR